MNADKAGALINLNILKAGQRHSGAPVIINFTRNFYEIGVSRWFFDVGVCA